MIEARLTELDQNEILSYLGTNVSGFDTAEIKKVEQCAELISQTAEPKLVYKRVMIKGNTAGIELEGRDIWNLLEGAGEAVIFAATTGLKVDQLIARLQVQDMSLAVIADACASTAIENICNNFESDLRKEIEREGLFLTERFSPGYGDLPIETQRSIGRFLNCQRRIGVIVSDKYLMTPIKSVTAIMGISAEKKLCFIHRCETCTSRDTCILRNARNK